MHRLARATLLVLAAFLAAHDAGACSICRCGDPSFTAIGANVFSSRQWRVALDWDRFDKENAVSRETGATVGRDAEVEDRVTLSAAYAWGDAVTLFVRVPYSRRDLTETDFAENTREVTRTRDLSDPEILLHVKVWSSPMTGLGRRNWVSLHAGLKTSWGRNNLAQGGVRLDEHAQTGTGSTDAIAGFSGVHIIGTRDTLFGSAQYRRTGTNAFDYRYGNVSLANIGYEHKFGAHLDGVFELNYRHAGRDVVDASGGTDPNTGGGLLYVQPRLVVSIADGLLLRFAALVPVARQLNGDQDERTVYSAGMTYVF